MPDLAFFTQLLETQYAACVRAVLPYAQSSIDDVRAVFQVQLADGTAWVMRAYRGDCPVPDWLVGCDAATTADWLLSRAGTLRYLEHQRYPAPRLITTRAGTLLGEAAGWYTFITTFVAGQVIDPTVATLHEMAAALGRLHLVRLDGDAELAAAIGKSWWYPELAIPAALQHYARVSEDLPTEWQSTVQAFCATLSAIQGQAAGLPRTIIHGDGWAGNAVQTASGQMIFIDWEPSGHGIAILDLGRLLLHCHQDLSTQLTPPIEPAEWRVHALIDGYCTARIPTPAERAVLLDAIRFGIAFGAATHFSSAQRDQWRELLPGRLTRRQHWYAVSEAIADMAHKRFDQLQIADCRLSIKHQASSIW